MTDKSHEEYNPFELMMKFRIFKELPIPPMISSFQHGFLNNLKNLELTEEFRIFAASTSGPDPGDNIYTLDCISRYLQRVGIKITDEYVPGTSFTQNQVLEISRITKYYFLMIATRKEAVDHYTGYLTDEKQKSELQTQFDYIHDRIFEILHDEYYGNGEKKVYYSNDERS